MAVSSVVSHQSTHSALALEDPEVFAAIRREEERLRGKIQLIASENYVSQAVLEATGSVLTQKYAEGLPGQRYYEGCEWLDVVERLAIERAKRLFGAEHANVQAHAGVQANMAVYFSVLSPGDTILGMNLTHGGHLSHGSPASFSGKLYRGVFYGVDPKTETIDFNEVESLAREHRPKLIVVGASAYPRTIDYPRFRAIADQVGALVLADIAHIGGLVAAGLHPSPVPVCEFVTMTTHKTLRGPRGGLILCKEAFAQSLDARIFPGMQGGPLMHIIAAKAVALKEALADEFKAYQAQILKNARTLADALMVDGFRLVSGGTDTHLMLVDLTAWDITGKEAQEVLDRTGITVNKNAIPFDKRGAQLTSGIRIGTPALTTRGMKEPEMKKIAGLIACALKNRRDEKRLEEVRREVRSICGQFPLYAQRLREGR